MTTVVQANLLTDHKIKLGFFWKNIFTQYTCITYAHVPVMKNRKWQVPLTYTVIANDMMLFWTGVLKEVVYFN